ELGISLLILVYLLSGAVEFGVLFFQFVQLRDASQEGALYGSTSPTSLSGIELRAREASNSPVDLRDVTKVDVSIFVDNILVWKNGVVQGSTTSACENHALQVKVDYEHRIFMPFMATFIGNPTIPLSASVTDTILTPVCPP
ncbi:MAG TPA: TadE family protein, partial [Anaerolineales bacterium]|nr:TadE family protein [Anaerolineales bacterium]